MRTIFSSFEKPPLHFRLTALTPRVRTVRTLRGKGIAALPFPYTRMIQIMLVCHLEVFIPTRLSSFAND
jgi:hypothetical protein